MNAAATVWPAGGDQDGQLYEDLYQHAPCAYLSCTVDGTIVRANRTFLEWTGHRQDEVVGVLRFADLLPPGARAFYETHHLAQLERTGELRGVTLDLVRSDGQAVPVLVSSVMVEPSPGRRLIRTTLLDATERRSYEQALVEARRRAEVSEQQVRILQRTAEACASVGPPEVLAGAVIDALSSVEGTKCCAVWLVDEEGGGLDLVAGEGPVAGRRPRLDASDADAVVGAWREGDLVVTVPEDVATTGPVVHVPIPGEQGVAGIIGCWRHAGAAVGDDDLATYRAAASQVGQALDRARLHAALERRAYHDELTGLPNRAMLRDRFEGAAARADRTGADTAVLVIDLDGFKAVNDRFGHARGDEVLVEVARLLARSIRPGDTVARLGGDEFAVLCEATDVATAETVAARIATLVAVEIPDGAGALRVGVSVGAAVGSGPASPGLDELLARADRQMYRDKRTRVR